MFPDLRFLEEEDTVGVEAGPEKLVLATVFGAEFFSTGPLRWAVRSEERVGLGEEERGGKSGSGGSGGRGGMGRELSPAVRRDRDRAETLFGGNQGFSMRETLLRSFKVTFHYLFF